MVAPSALLQQKAFCGSSAVLGRSNGSRVNAFFKGATKELKKAAPAIKKAAPSLPSLPSLNKAAPKNIKKEVKKAAPSLPSLPSLKKAAPSLPSFKAPSLPKAPASLKSVRKAVAAPIKKAVPKRSVGTQKVGTKRFGGGRKQTGGDALWLPNTERPAWLDGSMPGDRGFDPLGLAKPTEYLQVDLDQLDQNAAVNKAGAIVGSFKAAANSKISDTALQPYDEVFGLQRFRETELIHGRWAMLATLGVVVAEASTGVSWVDAGKVELDGARYLDFSLPFSISQLVWIEAILVGGAEIYRNRELAPEKRIYPGGYFDPLGLTSGGDEARTFKLKEAELKHGRLAMVAFLGFGVQALSTGEGALGSLAKFANSFAPELVEDVEKAIGVA